MSKYGPKTPNPISLPHINSLVQASKYGNMISALIVDGIPCYSGRYIKINNNYNLNIHA